MTVKQERDWVGISERMTLNKGFVVAEKYENGVIERITGGFPQYLANWIYH